MSQKPGAEDLLPLPHLSYHILLALADGTLHGWAVIRRISELTAGRLEPSTGSLYLAMLRLEEQGLLCEAPRPKDETDTRRKFYQLTPTGRRALELESTRLAQLLMHARRAGVDAEVR